MDTEGLFAPETPEAVRERYGALGPPARTVVTEVGRAMSVDAEEYDERVTDEVIETARDALFASLLVVQVGRRREYEDWRTDSEYEVTEVGSEHVDNVVWHAAPATGEAIAATFQDERRAAIDTLRRQAFGRIYREIV